MSLEKYCRTFEAQCDFCPENIDTNETAFRDAVVSTQCEGWRAYKTSGEWFHKCPSCCDSGANDFEDVS